jgi:hypothetical protein
MLKFYERNQQDTVVEKQSQPVERALPQAQMGNT